MMNRNDEPEIKLLFGSAGSIADIGSMSHQGGSRIRMALSHAWRPFQALHLHQVSPLAEVYVRRLYPSGGCVHETAVSARRLYPSGRYIHQADVDDRPMCPSGRCGRPQADVQNPGGFVHNPKKLLRLFFAFSQSYL